MEAERRRSGGGAEAERRRSDGASAGHPPFESFMELIVGLDGWCYTFFDI